jgi:glycogen debranching enzyme
MKNSGKTLLKLSYLIIILISSCSQISKPDNDILLPKISKHEGNYIVHYSNKMGSFWSTETSIYNSHWSTGYVSYRERLFGDIIPLVNAERPDRAKAVIEFTPVDFIRTFENGLTEIWFMPDEEDALVVEFQSKFATVLNLSVEDLQIWSDSVHSPIKVDSFFVASGKMKTKSGRWIAIASTSELKNIHYNEANELIIDLGDLLSSKIVFAISEDHDSAQESAIRVLSSLDHLKQQKRDRILDLYSGRSVQSSDQRLNQAWLWALASFDALNMNEVESDLGKGIYAGYPWFQDYWGRDSFIALRALTVTGQYDLASANLESFLKYQMLDSLNPLYGKIPNRVRPGDIIYNTADATPRFIIEADRYIAYSKDTAFARRIFPNIQAAVDGTLRYRTDNEGLLVHGDADTWMDAVGPKGPYSPRGNRAVDIQALWIDALQAAANIARFKRGEAADKLTTRAQENRDKALAGFLKHFVVDKTDSLKENNSLLDAISSEDVPSPQVRPNAFFAYHLLPGTQPKRDLARQLTEKLGTPWGVLSLDADDPWFHPYHKAEPIYEQDASYHNGIVWLWNTGAWVEALVRHGHFEQAWVVTKNYVDLMLDNITLGTLPELIDAMPRKGRFIHEFPSEKEFQGISRLDQMSLRNTSKRSPEVPALSGTWSQAWSLSEFIRNIVEDYGGLRYDLQQGFTLSPSIPKEWGDVLIQRQFAGYRMDLRRMTSVNGEVYLLRFEGEEKAAAMELPFVLPGMQDAVLLELSGFADVYEIREKRGRWVFTKNNESFQPKMAPANPWLRSSEGEQQWPLWNSDDVDVDKLRYRSQLSSVAN